MEATPRPGFLHRLDWYGVHHSICMTCFQTVATSYNHANLIEEEQRHQCAGDPHWESSGSGPGNGLLPD